MKNCICVNTWRWGTVDKRIVYDFIVTSFLDDIPTNKIWGWTKGGFFELERERDKSPLKLLIQDN